MDGVHKVTGDGSDAARATPGATKPATGAGGSVPSVADESSVDQWNAWSQAVRHQRSIAGSESGAPAPKKLKLPVPHKKQ